MEKNRPSNLNFKDITTLEELRQRKRILSSRMEHQEMMLQYQFRMFRQYISPSRLLQVGVEAITARSKAVGIFIQAFNAVRTSIFNRKK